MSNFNKLANMYEDMLNDPSKRKTSTGQMKQPTPYSELGMSDPDMVGESQDGNYLTAEEEMQWADMDKRMQARWDGKGKGGAAPKIPIDMVKKVAKIEKDINEMKELMMGIMKAHLQLMEKDG